MVILATIVLFLVGGFMVLAAFSRPPGAPRYDPRETLGDFVLQLIFHGIMFLVGMGLLALAFWIIPA